MDEKYLCYCGPYCENYSTKAKVEPAARALYSEMQHAGFEEIMRYLPDGEAFWSFLKGMAEKGACVSCAMAAEIPVAKSGAAHGKKASKYALYARAIHASGFQSCFEVTQR